LKIVIVTIYFSNDKALDNLSLRYGISFPLLPEIMMHDIKCRLFDHCRLLWKSASHLTHYKLLCCCTTTAEILWSLITLHL